MGGPRSASVEAYLELVLAGTPLPAEVPYQAEVAYSPRGEQAVVRFELPSVESVDVVADLDSRPDLTRMTPGEFEHFVRQLFEARGLEGWTTERTGDGVDAVVLNRDPMVGGLTIVQAKKYTRVLGVNHIRELVER